MPSTNVGVSRPDGPEVYCFYMKAQICRMLRAQEVIILLLGSNTIFNMKSKYLSLFLLAFLLAACNGKSDKSVTKPAPAATPAPANTGPVLPSVELATLEKLFKQGSAVDYIFHSHPFSMSQNDEASIKSTLAYFSSETVGRIPSNCKPVARQMYQINGEIVEEFDVYYSTQCKFFVQMKNEKPFAANKMTPAGDEFFQKVIAQAMNQNKQMQGN